MARKEITGDPETNLGNIPQARILLAQTRLVSNLLNLPSGLLRRENITVYADNSNLVGDTLRLHAAKKSDPLTPIRIEKPSDHTPHIEVKQPKIEIPQALSIEGAPKVEISQEADRPHKTVQVEEVQVERTTQEETPRQVRIRVLSEDYKPPEIELYKDEDWILYRERHKAPEVEVPEYERYEAPEVEVPEYEREPHIEEYEFKKLVCDEYIALTMEGVVHEDFPIQSGHFVMLTSIPPKLRYILAPMYIIPYIFKRKSILCCKEYGPEYPIPEINPYQILLLSFSLFNPKTPISFINTLPANYVFYRVDTRTSTERLCSLDENCQLTSCINWYRTRTSVTQLFYDFFLGWDINDIFWGQMYRCEFTPPNTEYTELSCSATHKYLLHYVIHANQQLRYDLTETVDGYILNYIINCPRSFCTYVFYTDTKYKYVFGYEAIGISTLRYQIYRHHYRNITSSFAPPPYYCQHDGLQVDSAENTIDIPSGLEYVECIYVLDKTTNNILYSFIIGTDPVPAVAIYDLLESRNIVFGFDNLGDLYVAVPLIKFLYEDRNDFISVTTESEFVSYYQDAYPIFYTMTDTIDRTIKNKCIVFSDFYCSKLPIYKISTSEEQLTITTIVPDIQQYLNVADLEIVTDISIRTHTTGEGITYYYTYVITSNMRMLTFRTIVDKECKLLSAVTLAPYLEIPYGIRVGRGIVSGTTARIKDIYEIAPNIVTIRERLLYGHRIDISFVDGVLTNYQRTKLKEKGFKGKHFNWVKLGKLFSKKLNSVRLIDEAGNFVGKG